MISVEEGSAVVGALLIRHSLSLAAHRDHIRAARCSAFFERRAYRFFKALVQFFVDETVFKGNAAGRAHGRDQAIFAERRPILRGDEVETMDAKLRSLTAHILERHLRAEFHPHGALLEPARALGGSRRLRGDSAGGCQGG